MTADGTPPPANVSRFGPMDLWLVWGQMYRSAAVPRMAAILSTPDVAAETTALLGFGRAGRWTGGSGGFGTGRRLRPAARRRRPAGTALASA